MRSERQKSRRKKRSIAKTDEPMNDVHDDDNDDNDENASVAMTTSAQKPKKRKLTVQEKCDLIAEYSEAILEDPEKAFASTEDEDNASGDKKIKRKEKRTPSKMQYLLALASAQDTDSDQYVAQLALMSLLAVFKDILPAYRVRVPTAQEMAVKVSRDTKKMWDHERALLQHYQQYLKLLERTWDAHSATSRPSQISLTAILSLAELLKTAFHFNFRSNLITAVVRQMSNGSSTAVRTACCDSIEFVFRNDAQGDVALEATRQVSKLIVKDRGFRVHPNVLRTFLALPLRVHVDEAVAAKLASQANAKKRKRNNDKETAEIEAELREGKATVDKIVLARCQSDTLQAVTMTYFRVLKNENLKASHIETLLPPSLEGLAKFAHLINMDTVRDLLGVLKDLLQQVELLPVDAALNCILTAFQTLQGPGKEMKIDQKEYIQPLYSQLPRLCSAYNSERYTGTLIRCLTLAFIQRREYSNLRVSAFFKQILTTAMHAPPAYSIPMIAFARQLVQRYPVLEQMLENEADVITVGRYTPDVQDPEHSNPSATSAWELATLKFHWHAGVSSHADHAASGKPLNFPAEDPARLLTATQRSVDDLYIPIARSRKKHPLQASAAGRSSDAKKPRNQVRFVTPRQYVPTYVEES